MTLECNPKQLVKECSRDTSLGIAEEEPTKGVITRKVMIALGRRLDADPRTMDVPGEYVQRFGEKMVPRFAVEVPRKVVERLAGVMVWLMRVRPVEGRCITRQIFAELRRARGQQLEAARLREIVAWAGEVLGQGSPVSAAPSERLPRRGTVVMAADASREWLAALTLRMQAKPCTGPGTRWAVTWRGPRSMC